jgi:acyl dehydratase
VGLPGRIVHGLCTMALTGRAVLETSGIDDPHALRRLAVRFSAPLFPGDTLTTSIWEQSGDGAYGFTAAGSDGNPVIKDGRAELR